MALLTYGEEVTMVVLDHELGRQMVDMCLAADAADEECNMIDKRYGFGDLTYEIILHLDYWRQGNYFSPSRLFPRGIFSQIIY